MYLPTYLVRSNNRIHELTNSADRKHGKNYLICQSQVSWLAQKGQMKSSNLLLLVSYIYTNSNSIKTYRRWHTRTLAQTSIFSFPFRQRYNF